MSFQLQRGAGTFGSLQSNLTLQSRRDISLVRLAQSATYCDWLAASPIEPVNREIRSVMRHDAEAFVALGRDPVIIPPRMIANVDPYYRDAEGWMPWVRCLTLWKSDAVNPDKDVSYLTIAWFQETWAFPIESRIFETIRGLDWDALAADGFL